MRKQCINAMKHYKNTRPCNTRVQRKEGVGSAVSSSHSHNYMSCRVCTASSKYFNLKMLQNIHVSGGECHKVDVTMFDVGGEN